MIGDDEDKEDEGITDADPSSLSTPVLSHSILSCRLRVLKLSLENNPILPVSLIFFDIKMVRKLDTATFLEREFDFHDHRHRVFFLSISNENVLGRRFSKVCSTKMV